MIDLRIQPSAQWFGLDFFTRKVEKASSSRPFSLNDFMELYHEVQTSFASLFSIPEKYNVGFSDANMPDCFLTSKNIALYSRFDENFKKLELPQNDNVCIDVSFEIPFNFQQQIEKVWGLCFDPSKGLGMPVGIKVLICEDLEALDFDQPYNQAHYLLIKQFQYILEQIALRGIAQLKHESHAKAAIIDQMVESNPALSGFLIPEKHLRSPYVQAIGVKDPEGLADYLQSQGILVEFRKHAWILPNSIVHSKESFFHLFEVMEKYT